MVFSAVTRSSTLFSALFLLLSLLPIALQTVPGAQADLPVVRATSPTVDVKDGPNLRKGYWTVLPDVELDIYYAQRSVGPKTVTFITDMDSISFEVAPGQEYDFIILLNDTRACRTRISTLRGSARRTSAGEQAGPVEIPFRIGNDNKIHIEGTINGSGPLDLMFDTGADTTVLYASARDKQVKLALNGTIENVGAGGTATRQTSNDNRLAIGDLAWDHEMVMLIDRQADKADGIIGYNIFEDKVVEIDYGRSVLRIHDAAPGNLDGYSRHEMKLIGTLPYIEVTIDASGKQSTDWFVLNTGNNGTVYLNQAFADKHGIYGSMQRLGSSRSGGVGPNMIECEAVQLPRLGIGKRELRELPITLEVASSGEHHFASHLGMEVLRRFDTIIDFQTNTIYLKPNSSISEPYRLHYSTRRTAVIATSVAAVLLLAAVVVIRRRRRRAARTVV